ncbi:hypothetical protein ACFSYD_11050 [Paracoccus aerius]
MQQINDIAPPARDSQAVPRVAGWLLAVAALALLVVVPLATYWGVRAGALEGLRNEGLAAAQSRALTLESMLDRQRAVVAILADDDRVKVALRAGTQQSRDEVSAKLERLRSETQSAVIYLMRGDGYTIAASNWDQPDSFVGHDYSFREYFRGALVQPTAMEFALGTVSGKPGLYLSHDVRDGDDLLGVVVVKVEFEALEAAWSRSPHATHVTEADGRVIITTQGQNRFKPRPPVAEEACPLSCRCAARPGMSRCRCPCATQARRRPMPRARRAWRWPCSSPWRNRPAGRAAGPSARPPPIAPIVPNWNKP